MMLSALDLARRIDAGALTPAGVIELCADAIAAREGVIGAFTALDIEGALRRAREDATPLGTLPLRGLPAGVKDIFDTADLPTQYGSPIYAGHRPAADAAIVSMLRRAGGLLLGKTVTTEFASLHPGRTRNPHNLHHTPGGSSSGSAAAVAAGMLPLAFGSQTGGSVIRPAAFCGVAGFKPSFKLFPTVGMKCFSWHLDTVGLFAAGVVDLAYAAAALTGRDLRVDQAEPGTPRVGLLRTPRWPEVSAAMQGTVETAGRKLAGAGAAVSELVLPPIFEDAYRAQAIIQDYEAYRSLAFEYDRHRDRLSALLRQQLEGAAATDVERYDDARRTTRRARQAFGDLAADFDVILTPSAPGAAPHGLNSTGLPIFNKLWTLLGNPSVNVPGLTDATGLPLGIQIVGHFGRDRDALAAARLVEGAIAGR
jgi:Asp-tRNA(Asn)/Glu-tRNA(Gln) amidotransferase A subunit family amidase